MPQSSATRQRYSNRVKRKDGGHTASTSQDVTSSSRDAQGVTSSSRHAQGVTSSSRHAQGVTSSSRHAQGVTSSSRHAQDVTLSSRDAQGVTSSSRDAQDVTSSSRNARDVTSSSRDAQGATSSSRDAQGVTSSSRDAQGVTSSSRDAQGVTSSLRHAQGVTSSSRDAQDVINRQTDRRVSERETGDGFTLTAELRWKLNQLEREKLQVSSKYNEQVSQYEVQVTRMRAQVERGEAQRQALEFDVAVAKRDVASERRKAEEKMRELREHNLKLDGVISDLHQRAFDLQRFLEITQKAREDDHEDLQTQLRERDRLLRNADADTDRLRADNSRLQTLTQEQTDTLHQMSEEMERIKRNASEREEKLRSELQVRMRAMEDALRLEKSSHADVVSHLELLKQKFSEVERAYTHERDQSQHTTHKLAQMENDHINMRTDLIGQLDQEKARSADLIGQLDQEKARSADLIGQLEQERAESLKLSVKLQEQESECTERQQQINQVQKSLVCVQQSHDSVLCDIVEVLQEYQQQGAAHTHHTGDGEKPNASALLDVIRRTLHNYNTQLQESVVVMQKLNHEMLVKDENITELQKNIQECEARCVCADEEVKRLRTCVADAAADADRAQTDLRRLAHQLQDEKTQHTHTQTQMNTLQQHHQRDSQEKLSFLHMLYQRLVAGCVLVMPAHSMLGSFSWAELSAMVQEHVDTLTSDLNTANQKVLCLESVCDRRSTALERVSDQMKQREEMWRRQRQDLDTHHTHITNQLQNTIQDLSRQLEEAEGRVCRLELRQSEQEQEVTRLQEFVGVCGRGEACLLAACGVLAGCVRALRRQVCVLMWQKAVLQERVCEAEVLQTGLKTLLHALADAGVKGQLEARGQQEVRGRAARRFRRCVIVVLAAGRLRALGRGSSLLFRVAVGYGMQPQVCVSDVKDTEKQEVQHDRVMKTLNSSELLVLIHTCMEGLHEELRGTDAVMSAVQRRCKKLFDRLLSDVDAQCWGHYGKGSLAQRLGLGLHKLTTDQRTTHSYTNSKVLVASLQKHILEFTQRLRSTEIERRNLRLQLSRTRRKDTHTACVPAQRFESVCSELGSALEREQCAQRLLRDQATQLQQLDANMQLHTQDKVELAHAVQSLCDSKRELKRKDLCLRSLGKQFNQSQQEKKLLQQTLKRAEDALSTAAQNRESLMSYVTSVEDRLKEMKDDIIVCKGMTSQDHVTLQRPLLPHDPPSSIRDPQTDACQSLVRCFLDLHQLMQSKMSSYASHITAEA